MEDRFKQQERDLQKRIAELVAEKQRLEYDAKQRDWQLNAENKEMKAKFDQEKQALQNQLKQFEWTHNQKLSDYQLTAEQLRSDNQLQSSALKAREAEVAKLNQRIQELEKKLDEQAA